MFHIYAESTEFSRVLPLRPSQCFALFDASDWEGGDEGLVLVAKSASGRPLDIPPERVWFEGEPPVPRGPEPRWMVRMERCP